MIVLPSFDTDEGVATDRPSDAKFSFANEELTPVVASCQ